MVGGPKRRLQDPTRPRSAERCGGRRAWAFDRPAGAEHRQALATHLDPRHGRGRLLWYGLEKRLHGVQSAKDYRAHHPRDHKKPEKAGHVAKSLLGLYGPNAK